MADTVFVPIDGRVNMKFYFVGEYMFGFRALIRVSGFVDLTHVITLHLDFSNLIALFHMSEQVQYHCQPVGLILAETVKAAQEAAKLVEMYFAGFEVPVVTIADACRAESFMGLSEENKRGDVTKFFEGEGVAGCRTLKGKVKSNSQKHFYMEPHTVRLGYGIYLI